MGIYLVPVRVQLEDFPGIVGSKSFDMNCIKITVLPRWHQQLEQQ